MPSPEELAREKIDALLHQCGWVLQKRSTINLAASRGGAIREALLKDRDEVDYLLFVDGKAIGTVEAKPEGYTLTGVEEQSGKYGKGLLDIYPKFDIFWLKDESLEDSANLPDPDIIAAEIVEDLQAALAQFAEIANDLEKSK